MRCTRRTFLAGSLAVLASARVARPADGPPTNPRLARKLGVTTSSVDRQVSWQNEPGKISLMDLPRVLREDLDLDVVDLNTNTLGSPDPRHAEKFRAAADKAGVAIVNLKLNLKPFDLGSADAAANERTLAECRRWVDAAAAMGCPRVRPFPQPDKPDMDRYVAAWRQLDDYAMSKGVGTAVENYGWMQSDPASVPTLIKALARDVVATPDTGNWTSDEVRYAGLAATFPLAYSCDFKARELGPNGEHTLYDLRRCFQIGWDLGFRGPWCFEHAHADRAQLWRELGLLRDMLRGWMTA